MTDRVNPTIDSKGSQIGPSAVIPRKMSRNRRIELLSYQTEELQGRLNYCWPIRQVFCSIHAQYGRFVKHVELLRLNTLGSS